MDDKSRFSFYFYLVWFLISVATGVFVLNRIFPIEIDLPSVSISSLNKVSINQTMSIDQAIDVSGISERLQGFDNFFPLSALARLHPVASTSYDTNAFVEIPSMSYRAKVKGVRIYCAEEQEPRFDSQNPTSPLSEEGLFSLRSPILDYFSCNAEKLQLFDFSVIQDIPPNSEIRVVAEGEGVVVTQFRSVRLDPDTTTKISSFLVVFFLILAAGRVFHSYILIMAHRLYRIVSRLFFRYRRCMQKLYCYVDESGQDDASEVFVVVAVVIEGDQQSIRERLERIELAAGTHHKKWHKVRHKNRMTYLASVLEQKIVARSVYVAHYRKPIPFFFPMIVLLEKAIKQTAKDAYRVNVYVDGIDDQKGKELTNALRASKISLRLVKSRRDESEPLIRLADMWAGCVRSAFLKNEEAKTLVRKAKEERYLKDITEE